MKALTVLQPYAHLISLPDDNDEAKRVENRKWATAYRGLLAIHAGKGRDYLDEDDLEKWPNMVFGAIVAVANLVGCVELESAVNFAHLPEERLPAWAKRRWPWLADHQHVEGPFCWVLTEVRAIEPVPCRGAQGLWEVPLDVLLNNQYRKSEE